MSVIGNTPTSQNFVAGTDYFNGTGSQTAFTLTRTISSVNDISAVINNVVQQPNTAYTVLGNVVTFTSAPSAGTANIYVRYLSTTTQTITPSQGTVSYSTLNSDMQSKQGISFKNRIINGAMVINQRGFSGNITTGNEYTLDRFQGVVSVSNKFSVAQSSTAPAGFSNSLLATSTSAYTVGAAEQYIVVQRIEAYNVNDLAWGTVNAKTVTLSFWVQSSLTGTFGGALFNSNGSRSYPFTYSIPVANTWTQISITIAGDQSGTWAGTNGVGITVSWGLGVGATYSGTSGTWAGTYYSSATGATSVVGTSGATFYITGVQLEEGTTATSFEREAYSVTLQKCQRYYERWLNTDQNLIGFCYTTNNLNTPVQFAVEKRANPTLTRTGTFTAYCNGGGNTLNYVAYNPSPKCINIQWSGSGITAGQAFSWSSGGSGAVLQFDAEL